MDLPLTVLFLLRIIGPAVLLLIALSLLFVKSHPPSLPQHTPIVAVVVRVVTPRRTLIVSLLALAALTYFLDALVIIVFAVLKGTWQTTQPQWRGTDIGDIIGLLAFSLVAIFANIKESQNNPVWEKRRIRFFAAFACVVDIAIVFLMVTNISFRPGSVDIPERQPTTQVSIPAFAHLLIAVLRLLFSIPLLIALAFPKYSYVTNYASPTPILSSSFTHLTADDQSQYGTFTPNRSPNRTPAITSPPSPINDVTSQLPKKPDPKEEIALDPSWTEMGRRISRLTPYLWPQKSRVLQSLCLLSILVLAFGRLVNFAMPLTLGKLISVFENYGTPDAPVSLPSPWLLVLTYCGLRFLQSSGGLPALRSVFWVPVMQYSDREMSQMTFNHLLNLSLAFHTRRKTGEILRILDRGQAINHILELFLFNILPTIADIAIALTFFLLYFSWTLAAIIFVVMVAYVFASITMTTWRTKIRRKMNDQDVVTRGIHTDCLLNYETVKYFGGELHEGERYADAIRKYQGFEYRVMISLELLNLVQTTIITLGLLAGSFIVANGVVHGQAKPSDFVIFITYLGQLYGPLNQLGYVYRSINQSLVDTERLMKLLDEPTDVNDKPNAEELVVTEGEIEFDNVSFSYDDGRSQALKGVTFTIPKGSRVALVGESGSGKSTILRLLYRFYDLRDGEGRILIDGKDIRDVTQTSLRKAIGVVPQDSVLFNTSIAHNVGYGKFGASRDEIESAAKLAQMHERIMSFPDGYDTKVGERGVRLSGGEKQRVAIARTLLKNPPILLLDEATSALDTSTERDIQRALENLVKGRSSLSIAHRLSTISSADVILVLKDGQVVERGSHKELLVLDGLFAKMWADQITADRRAQSMSMSLGKEGKQGYFIDDLDPPTSLGQDSTAKGDQQREEENVQISDATFTVEPEQDVAQETEAGREETRKEEGFIDQNEDGETGSTKIDASNVAFPTVQKEVEANQEGVEPKVAAGTIAFPSRPEEETGTGESSLASPTNPSGSGTVTFSAEIESGPTRTGTPEPSGEPKRKRLSSQNLQRLARRISLGGKRTGSQEEVGATPESKKKKGKKGKKGAD